MSSVDFHQQAYRQTDKKINAQILPPKREPLSNPEAYSGLVSGIPVDFAWPAHLAALWHMTGICPFLPLHVLRKFHSPPDFGGQLQMCISRPARCSSIIPALCLPVLPGRKKQKTKKTTHPLYACCKSPQFTLYRNHMHTHNHICSQACVDTHSRNILSDRTH